MRMRSIFFCVYTVLGNTDYGAVDPGNCVTGTPTYIKGEQKSPPERVAGWPPAGVWGCWATRTDTEPLRCGGPTIDPQAEPHRDGGSQPSTPRREPIARTKRLSTLRWKSMTRPKTLSTLRWKSMIRPKTLSTLTRESIIGNTNYQFLTFFQAGSGTTIFDNNYRISTLIIDFRL